MVKSYIPTLPQILMHPISRPKFTFFKITYSTDHSWPPLTFVTMAVQLSSLPQLQQLSTTKLDRLSLALLRTVRLVYDHLIRPLFLQRFWRIMNCATKSMLISSHIVMPRFAAHPIALCTKRCEKDLLAITLVSLQKCFAPICRIPLPQPKGI